jgi:hypothetical protein
VPAFISSHATSTFKFSLISYWEPPDFFFHAAVEIDCSCYYFPPYICSNFIPFQVQKVLVSTGPNIPEINARGKQVSLEYRTSPGKRWPGTPLLNVPGENPILIRKTREVQHIAPIACRWLNSVWDPGGAAAKEGLCGSTASGTDRDGSERMLSGQIGFNFSPVTATTHRAQLELEAELSLSIVFGVEKYLYGFTPVRHPCCGTNTQHLQSDEAEQKWSDLLETMRKGRIRPPALLF